MHRPARRGHCCRVSAQMPAPPSSTAAAGATIGFMKMASANNSAAEKAAGNFSVARTSMSSPAVNKM